MKYSEAVKITKHLLPFTQKFRSNAKEALEHSAPTGTTERAINMALFDMFPWIFDDMRIMRMLGILNDRLDNGGEITGMEFYNLMTMFHRFEPEATMAIELAFEIKLPEPSPSWVVGWDPE